jgi:L-threonylcarbamoyladenylate synthase
MQTLRLNLENLRAPGSEERLQQAASIIRHGGLVAFPTETVYGLGANALDRDAILKIFEAKQRPAWDPIIVHAANLEMLKSLVREWPEKAEVLASKFMPGPLTLLLPKTKAIPDECTAGRDKVGVRIPNNKTALSLITMAGVPIAAPSANRFGSTSPTTVKHVLRDLDGRIDAVVDGGECMVGVESTVLDPTLDPPVIYRPGGLSREKIESAIGRVVIAERAIADTPPEALESPGLGIRHYAPHALVQLVDNEEEIRKQVKDHSEQGKLVGLMLPEGWLRGESISGIAYDWGSFDHLDTLARRLYFGLRWLDEKRVDVILCPLPPAKDIGVAIRDRLTKAAK